MRVLQIHNRYRQPGGEDRAAAAEAALLEANGHTVRRFLADNPIGWRTAPALLTSTWNPASPGPVGRAARDAGAEVAHVHNTWFVLTASALSRLTCPVVMTLHNFRLTCASATLFRDGAPCRLCLDGSALNAVRFGCYRGRLASVPAALNVGFHRWRETWPREVGLFVALTEFSRRTMIEAGLPADRILIKANFVEDPGPRLMPAAASDVLLFVGRLDSQKGVALLASLIRRSDRSLRWLIVGEGPGRVELEGLAGVEITGWQPRSEVDRLLRSSRALLVPSLGYEGQPMAVLEAFAAGLPVLGSDQGGLGETVAPLGPSFLAAPGDAEAWMAALGGLADDSVIAAASGQARALYQDRYSPEQGLRGLEALYRQAIVLGPGPYR